MNRDAGPGRTLPLRPIRHAQLRELEQVAGLLARAFLDGPVADWLVPDPAERLRIYHSYFRMFAEHAIHHGFVQVNSDCTAVGVWYPSGETGGKPRGYEQRLAALTGPHLRRFQQLDAAFAAVHPRAPHEYLAFLAVDPTCQGMGHGSRLLSTHHDLLDRLDRPAYLEATTPRNRDLYLRHGYTVIGKIPLPDGGPSLWPMWRSPTSPARGRAGTP